ncbi:MAG: cytochrome P450 [Chloroflexi bacterium]|nr:cytochrome P450 [Chloroflexota bacterium]
MSISSPIRYIPQPPTRPIVGNVPDIGMETPVQNLMKLAQHYGPIFRVSFPNRTVLVVSSAELVAEISDQQRFDKLLHGPLIQIRDFAGDGLFTAYTEEANWSKAHRLLMPAFGPASMRNYFDDMLDIADQLFTKWERQGPETDFDVADNMTRLTLDTIALCGFGYRFNSFYQREMHPFVEAMVRALAEAGARARRLSIQTKLMRSTQRQYEADMQYMHGITDELIAKRRSLPSNEVPNDLLGLMLNAKDSITGEGLDDANIRNQLVTFLIAGHETTSGLLSFATYFLLQQPKILQRAQAIVDQVLGDRLPRYEDLAKLGYLDQILRETLRLWPTAPVFGVYAKHDTSIGGFPVKQGEKFIALLPTLHRDPKVWHNPNQFDPDRFAPEVREQITEHAWKPFGNGQRACIGRSFAMQEATLVLAMMLQRFELTQPQPYHLHVKETLTLKPEGLTVRARVRKNIVRSAKPTQPNVAIQSSPNQAQHNTPLLVLYGSNSGSSEAFARRIASDGEARGYQTTVAALNDYVNKLPTTGAVSIVAASYNGQPADNAQAFCQWLANVAPNSLKGVRYSVFGCGNRDWQSTYQAVPTQIDQHLQAAGAERLLERGAADARSDFFGDFERWYAPFWQTHNQTFAIASAEISSKPLYQVELLPSSSDQLAQQTGFGFASVLENRELVDLSSPLGRSKRHIELRLPSELQYQAGDYLAILPQNHPSLIERACKHFGLKPEQTVILHATRGAANLPIDRPISLGELLSSHVELATPATQRDLELLAQKNVCPPHQIHLAALAADHERYTSEILQKRLSLLDLLEQYPSSVLDFGEFLELLPAMRVRQYSISSSSLLNSNQASLTVAVVDAPAWSGKGQFYGTCSSYLARLQVGDQIAVSLRQPHIPFRPPSANSTPLLMICAGTGLAPFRGFIQERVARQAQGEALGPNALFFGCDHPEVDLLYHEQIQAWQQAGVLKFSPAFYRQPIGEVSFVQHRLWQERQYVWSLIEQGAVIAVCGDGRSMAPAVRETLARIYAEATGSEQAAGMAWIAEIEQAGRYVADVFG